MIKKLFASLAAGAVAYLTQKIGPEATALVVSGVTFVVGHYFHKQLPPGVTGGVGDP